MNPIKFKKIWMKDASERWAEFPKEQVQNSKLNEKTKEFLIIGFPEDAAPFLGFGLRSYDGKFNTIWDCFSDYELDEKTKNYWILGSDNNGNPICIDSSDSDKIVLIDHEQDFEVFDEMNNNISELAHSLLLYKDFIEDVNKEFGKDGFYESKFTERHVSDLEEKFSKLNPNYQVDSPFWSVEFENLRAQVK